MEGVAVHPHPLGRFRATGRDTRKALAFDRIPLAKRTPVQYHALRRLHVAQRSARTSFNSTAGLWQAVSMNAPTPHDEILRTLRTNRDELRRRSASSEDDTRALLIEPFLEYLGHDVSHRRSEHEFRGHRPDEVIYRDPVSLSPDRFASIVLEAKPLGTAFDRQTGAGRANTPARQIARYLRHHEASGPGTFGVLTDGDRYRLLRRTPHGADVETIGEWRILDDDLVGEPHPIETLAAYIHRDALDIPPAIVARDRPARALADAIAAGHGPDSLLELLTVASERTRPITEELTITGQDTGRRRKRLAGTRMAARRGTGHRHAGHGRQPADRGGHSVHHATPGVAPGTAARRRSVRGQHLRGRRREPRVRRGRVPGGRGRRGGQGEGRRPPQAAYRYDPGVRPAQPAAVGAAQPVAGASRAPRHGAGRARTPYARRRSQDYSE